MWPHLYHDHHHHLRWFLFLSLSLLPLINVLHSINAHPVINHCVFKISCLHHHRHHLHRHHLHHHHHQRCHHHHSERYFISVLQSIKLLFPLCLPNPSSSVFCRLYLCTFLGQTKYYLTKHPKTNLVIFKAKLR